MSVLVGPSALNRNGLVPWYDNMSMQTTNLSTLNGRHIAGDVIFYFLDVHNDSNELHGEVQTRFAPAGIPTPERALIDYMRHLDDLEEFYLVEGLREYVRTRSDLTRLYEVAAHYNATELLNYWLEEIKDTSDLE